MTVTDEDMLYRFTCEVVGAWRDGTDMPAAMRVMKNLLEAAAQAERDAVVKWLRVLGLTLSKTPFAGRETHLKAEYVGYIAQAIEAREHVTPVTDKP